jgi:hypothetical protein
MGTIQIVRGGKTFAAARVFMNGQLVFPPLDYSNGYAFDPSLELDDLGEGQLQVTPPRGSTTQGVPWAALYNNPNVPYSPYPRIVWNPVTSQWLMDLSSTDIFWNAVGGGAWNDPTTGNNYDYPYGGVGQNPSATVSSVVIGVSLTLTIASLTGTLAWANGTWNLVWGL